MKHLNHFSLWILVATVVFSTGCRQAENQRPQDTETSLPLSVYVVNYPLQYFAERIGGDRVEVQFPAPSDVDPAEWRPDDETILRYQRADLIFLNGVGYARWIRHASLPALLKIDTAAGFREQFLEVPNAVTHSHGAGSAHSHAGTAFTTWLNPLLAIEHARAVKDALTKRLPSHSDEFEERFNGIVADFQALDQRLIEIVKMNSDQALLASHPVYQYLEARYQLNLESLHWEPDEMPDVAEWEALDRILAQHPAKWILWEDEPLLEIVDRLVERGVGSIVYDPTSQSPEKGDLLSAMRQNAANLELAFTSGREP